MEAAKLLVLDEGFVSLFSCAPNGEQLQKIINSYFAGIPRTTTLRSVSVYIEMQVPIAVYLQMYRMCFIPDRRTTARSWLPTEADIKSPTLETSKEIAKHLRSAIEASDLNVEAMTMDGCDGFIAKIGRTLASYWSGLAYASLEDWWQWCITPGAPHLVKLYQNAIKNLLLAEYKDIESVARRAR